MARENKNICDKKRRHFLKAASVLGTTGPFLSGIVSADQEGENSIRLIEVGMDCSLPPIQNANTRYQIHHWENPPSYLVDRTESAIGVYKEASSSARRKLLEGSQAINAKTLSSAPMLLFNRSVNTLQINPGVNLNATHNLQLDRNQQLPSVSVQPERQNTKVEVVDSVTTVESGSLERVELPEQTLAVKTISFGDPIENPDIPPHLRGLEIEKSSQMITLNPTLLVRDRGHVDVFDRTNQFV